MSDVILDNELKSLLSRNVGRVIDIVTTNGQLYGDAHLLRVDDNAFTVRWVDAKLLQAGNTCLERGFYDKEYVFGYDDIYMEDKTDIKDMSQEEIAKVRAASVERDDWLFQMHDDFVRRQERIKKYCGTPTDSGHVSPGVDTEYE